MPDAAATLESVLGRPIAVQEVSARDAVTGMIAAGFPDWVAEVSGLEYGAAYTRGWGDYAPADFTDVTGKPGRSFAVFSRDHAALLGGAQPPGVPACLATTGEQAGPLARAPSIC